MTKEDWDRAKAIFTEADALPAADRIALLNERCGGNAELRARVEGMLAEISETETVPLLNRAEAAQMTAGYALGGRFRIVRFLGRGGMGEVYQAEDQDLKGTVAVKTLRPELVADPDFLARFRREIQVARQVTHPNVCRVFDVGYDGPRVFLTMEFLDGETLGQRMRRVGALAQNEAYRIVAQMAAGLGALHEAGVIHRDFKPGNVMIVRGGSSTERAVIGDFGLARSVTPNEGQTLTQGEQVMGTPEYMSPEQMLGKPVTPASDIYSLGLVMYELVTGRKPYPRGGGLENALNRVLEAPAPADELNPVWRAAIFKCLERNPADRPQTAAELMETLRAEKPSSIVAQPVQKRWLWPVVAVASILLALLAGWSRLERWLFTTATAKQSVALLPLRVMNDDPALRVFADGLMESITSRMTQFEGGTSPLLVVPASEVRNQAAKSAGDARQKFQAATAVEGTIESQGDRLRLLLTVIDTETMRQVASIALDDRRGNSWQLQDTAVARLANSMRLRLQPQYASDQQRLSPVVPGAYEFYLQARGYMQRNDRAADLASAIELLNRAISLDPNFALAHSALGQAYLYQYLEKREPERMQMALASGQKALSLSPQAPETNIAYGNVLYGTGRNEEAKQRFEAAIAADGKNHEAYQGLAKAYLGLKDYAKAEATYVKAITMRPDDWTGYKSLGLYHYERRNFTAAAEQFQRVVELTPDNAQGYNNVGAALSLSENWDGAEKAWLRAIDLDPKGTGPYTNLGKLYLDERHDASRAVPMYQKAVALNERDFRAWGQLGRAYRRLDDKQKAAEAFAKAIELIDAEILVNPKFVTLYSNLILYRALAGRPDYQAAIDRALALAPGRGETMLRAAEAYAITGNAARAREYAAKATISGTSMRQVQRSEYLKAVLAKK